MVAAHKKLHQICCACVIFLSQTCIVSTLHSAFMYVYLCLYLFILDLTNRSDLIILSFVCVLCLTCLFSFIWTVHSCLEIVDTPSVCLCMCYNKACSSEETDTAPLPWRRPIWQEPKRCWRDHCHLGPNEIQLSPNVRQDDSKRWATWQPARQAGRQTDTSTNIHTYNAYTNILHKHTEMSNIFSEVPSTFQCPVTPVVLYWLTAILRHYYTLIASCLKFESTLQEIQWCCPALDSLDAAQAQYFIGKNVT